MVKVGFISDTHGRHGSIYQMKEGDSLDNMETLYHISGGVFIPNGLDIIIHAGDISMGGTEYEIDNFLKWFNSLDVKYRIFCAGNHDKLFEFQKGIAQELIKKYPDIIYLESQEIIIDGVKIYGEPRQPRFGHGWAFNVDRGEKIKQFWDMIPDDVDILITHGPPYDILDMTMYGGVVGCVDLLNRIKELKNLKIHCWGHIHEDYGYVFKDGIHFVNASVLNIRYQLQNKPQIFEIDENKNVTKL